MNQLPTTGPHFIGLWVALAGLVTVAFVLVRRRARGSARPRRRTWGLLIAAFVAVGVFGNGVYGVAQKAAFWDGAYLSYGLPHSQARVEEALDVALSPEFVAYHGELRGEAVEFTGAEVEARLTTQWEAAADVPGRTGGGSPVAPDATILTYLYYDTHNLAFELVGLGVDAREKRYDFLNALAHDYLPELVALRHLHQADEASQRISALHMIRSGVPTTAEWIRCDLDHLPTEGLTDAERTELVETRAFVQRYIDDPSLRGLPEDLSNTLD